MTELDGAGLLQGRAQAWALLIAAQGRADVAGASSLGDDARKILGHILRDEFDTGDLAVAVVRRGAGSVDSTFRRPRAYGPNGLPKVTSSTSEYSDW